MNEIKPFSESISTGSVSKSKNIDSFAVYDPTLGIHLIEKGMPEKMARAIIARISDEKISFRYMDEMTYITPDLFEAAKKELRKSLISKAGPEALHIHIKELLKVPYDKKVMIKSIASKLVPEVAKIRDVKLTAKLLGKYVLKAIPWIAGGALAVEIGSRLFGKSEKKSESNRSTPNIIPYGENYHKDIGWY